jgi:1-acyl-sn-glycerol-3-phosphate acyltransferase
MHPGPAQLQLLATMVAVYWLLLLAFFLMCFALAAYYLAPYWQRYRAYARAVATCGYLPDPPKPRAVRLLNAISRCVTGYQVGKIKASGVENLPKSGPAVIALNHPHYTDGFVVQQLLPRPARYMGAQWVFRLPFGIGPLLARCGGFAVDTTSGKGGPARDAAVKVLTTDQQLVLCPEGETHLDGALGQFKKGAVRIAREAAEKLGTPVPIIPVCLRYGKYPGSWIMKWPKYRSYAYLILTAWYYRRGVTVVVGKPIGADELSGDDEKDTELLRSRVAALDPAGR